MFTGASTKLSTKSILDTLCSDQLSFIILYSCVVVWVVFFLFLVSCFLSLYHKVLGTPTLTE